ncbi:MAG: hypothetical protein AAGE59_27970 [Cyanobacteria bacterium P01_F01_bin.86]
MKITQASQPLTPELIHEFLVDNGSSFASAAYVRLMEIYCVVKAGGIAEQTEVARRLEAIEKAVLQKEIQALSGRADAHSRVQALEQEIQELERSVAHRLQYLATIQPEEAAIVESCVSEIDSFFRNRRNRK